MSVEGAGSRADAGDGMAEPGEAGVDQVVPEGRGDVRGFSDLAYQVITPYLSHPVLHRSVRIVLWVLGGVCLVATGVRLSPLPLLPLPLFGFGYYALHRVRAAGREDRPLLVWSILLLVAVVVGFWVLSVAARWVSGS
ncbi:hypothetical protein FNH05_11695 [Amycolatopsis rhizosphaerae]|uniref:Uncharacterized protein n=1 Tax=Amycolatopsis rhizosphaerae TaxID=2053003 RepID=A0A558CXT7_9PSEU|nr:hypothetical protein [Amycolatopsis rhizosphaerae]TVT53530.1 hypothetical protein FNH05_11695 [Amycolatopsis rhizosphaerae]